MEVALFVPCYVDQFYPGAARATLELLEKLGVKVSYPEGQTCCGQPMANSGYEHLTGGCNENFIKRFQGYDYIVSPSGSCVLHIKDHLHSDQSPTISNEVRERVYELTEFLTDILKVTALDARFPHRVGVHQSCHGQRGLMLSQMSELTAEPFSKPGKLLSMVKDIELIELDRKDECCGFGGTFCVAEEAVSVKMGKDRVADHLRHGAEFITGADMSCLMHMEGILRRHKSATKVIHIAEILNSQ
ncbi:MULTISPECIES: (Fe-S)-binding protein [Olivibacter]|jgi:L-lactate dehydrogenase complex protein LldE|uniref:(Fe-S)-binding protein n=2 Tax=Olivibacter TaxID=376469 RepID=A0ABV6HF07_9SPHI|nr:MULTISPECIES: (Fe-S)-binding protein [Olivibacter]MCL4639812.1 (Fe-S)-binding protein [Olivibacter sp. UJ_SKK_5.1]MDM8177959.1 (Fe-S)-binding protein [Olivibacter sp. 47]MDX3917127.1 (Fe-S)-binding protein [Pseudosphingobacterium sp.]QEK99266.1 (Fe-S)-binding protein [Olivibacter sp. LS-1]